MSESGPIFGEPRNNFKGDARSTFSHLAQCSESLVCVEKSELPETAGSMRIQGLIHAGFRLGRVGKPGKGSPAHSELSHRNMNKGTTRRKGRTAQQKSQNNPPQFRNFETPYSAKLKMNATPSQHATARAPKKKRLSLQATTNNFLDHLDSSRRRAVDRVHQPWAAEEKWDMVTGMMASMCFLYAFY